MVEKDFVEAAAKGPGGWIVLGELWISRLVGRFLSAAAGKGTSCVRRLRLIR